MNRFLYSLQRFSLLARRKRWRSIYRNIRHRILSVNVEYGMHADLSNEIPETSSELPIELRLLEKCDIPILFDPDTLHTESSGIEDRVQRLLLVDAGSKTCYVAVTNEGIPCAALWLLGRREAQQIPGHSNETHPEISEREMILESLFTLEEYRNKGIMSTTVRKLLRLAKHQQIRRVIAFVGADNLPCIRVLERAGFERYALRREKWILFRRKQEFESIPTRLRNSRPPSPEEKTLAIELAE